MAGAETQAGPLTSVADVARLSIAERQRGREVRLRGVVTEYAIFRFRGTDYPSFYIQDDTGGISVEPGKRRFDLHSGDLVEVTGLTTQGPSGAMIVRPKVEYLGKGSLPSPLQVDHGMLSSGRVFSKWVAVRGIIRYVWAEEGWVTMDLAMDGGRVLELLIEDRSSDPDPPDLRQLIGARVRVEGVVWRSFAEGHPRVCIPGTGSEHIFVEARPPEDPMPDRIQPIAELHRFGTKDWGRRVRVAGAVTFVNGRSFGIEDGTGAILAGTREDTLPIRPGDEIEATAYATDGDDGPMLTYTLVRLLGTRRAVSPRRVRANDVLDQHLSAALIEISGNLVSSTVTERGLDLTLEDGGTQFGVELTQYVPNKDQVFVPGSTWRVTGAVLPHRTPFQGQSRTFRVMPRSDGDLVFVSPPSWWTATHIFWLLALVGLAGSASITLNIVLKRRIAAQTEVIRRRLEQEAALEARYRDLVEHASDVVMTCDMEGRILSVNAASERVSGYTRSELEKMSVLDLATPESLSCIETQLRDIRHGRDLRQVEIDIRRRDRETATLEVSARTVARPGAAPFIEAIARDITARKKVLAASQSAKEAAEAANRAKSEFLANMSHEIRTPMNGIIGMTGLALATELTGEQREYLSAVHDSAQHLITVINDILDFSKIEAGKLELDSHEFDLRDAIGTALHSLAITAHGKGLELICRIDPAVPRSIVGDRIRLVQILTNLVGNATKFTDSGEIEIAVKPVECTDGWHTLEFSVRDTGTGIPPEKQTVIFDSFAQADSSSTRRFGGTGLGLTISQRLVRMMGGHIWVISEVGQGSTFYFTARFTPGTARPLAPNYAETAALIVEANDASRAALTQVLSSFHLRPIATRSAEEALAIIQTSSDDAFGVCLIALRSSEVDNFAARIAKLRPALARRTIILASSTALVHNTGVDGLRARWLMKPVKQSELESALEQVLGGSNAATDVVQPRAPLAAAGPAHRRQVLVAEDNQINQLVASRMLERLGYAVTVAPDGRAAVEHWREGAFDAIFMDVQMPVMDGLEATRMIRSDENGTRTPIIAMTAHALNGDRERCLNAGMDAYVPKPVQDETLRQVLVELGLHLAAQDASDECLPDALSRQ